jgi:hypothetical protein
MTCLYDECVFWNGKECLYHILSPGCPPIQHLIRKYIATLILYLMCIIMLILIVIGVWK